MTKILLIDDEKLILEPLVRALEQQKFEVHTATDGEAGLEAALTLEPDIVVLDVMMPKMDGWVVCRELRQKSAVPILMLTALGEEIDRILGLELGADDYLTKPFSTRELIARIKAMLRRVAIDKTPAAIKVQELGPIKINYDTRELFKNGTLLPSRYKEFELLTLLAKNIGQVVTRATIFDEVWGTDWLGDTRTLDVHIRWLREKIEDNPSKPKIIQTVRSVGYRYVVGE